MTLLLILSFIALIFSTIFIYYTQYLQAEIIWYLIPVEFIVAWMLSFLLFVVFLMISIMFHHMKKKVLKPRRFYNVTMNMVAKFLILLYNIHVVYENSEILPKDQKFLMVFNHQSNLDPIAIIATFKDLPLTFIMKDNIMKVPFLGRYLHAGGFIPIDRNNDRKGLESILQGIKRLKLGYPMGIYPEGHRSKGPELLDFRNGAFKLAQKAEVPMVICAIDGFYKLRSKCFFVKAKVLIRCCEVIPYEEFKDLHTNDIGDRVHDIIQKNLDDARRRHKWLNLKKSK